jgi:hypothetical protein
MIVTFTPYARDLNLGRAYNDCMALLPNDDDWAIMLDHDAMWTTRDWYRQIAEVTQGNPKAIFVAVTNRIASKWQQSTGSLMESHDLVAHRAHGTMCAEWRRTLLKVTHTRGFGGVAFALSKRCWREAGGFADGLPCVDHSMHFRARAVGYDIYAMESLYVYHWRRANGDDPSKDWPKAANCPCRGLEPAVNERIEIDDFVRC